MYKAHRVLYHPTLGSRGVKTKKKKTCAPESTAPLGPCSRTMPRAIW